MSAHSHDLSPADPQAVHDADAHSPHGSPHHVSSWQLLVGIWIILLFFTTITIVAAFLPIQSDFIRAAIAIIIASIKATIVALFFMHLLHDERFNMIVFAGGVLFVIIFFAFTLMDPLTRGEINPIVEKPIEPMQARSGAMLLQFHNDPSIAERIAHQAALARGEHPAADADHATTGSTGTATSDHGSTPEAGPGTAHDAPAAAPAQH